MHVRLVLAVEKAFRIRFSSSEVSSFANAGDLVDAVGHKMNKRADV